MKLCLLLLSLTILFSCSSQLEQNVYPLNHGPYLGRQTTNSMMVWARTEVPAQFHVRYGLESGSHPTKSVNITTQLKDDNTGTVSLNNLKSGTRYYYAVYSGSDQVSPEGTFKTLRDGEKLKSALNPKGLFNFNFEFACGNNQGLAGSQGPSLPAFQTLNKKFRDDLDFAILNGDWIYEDKRDYSPKEWMKQVGADKLPRQVELCPNITGVWENYKTYMNDGKPLADWHRNLPSYFTFDDHEILNDVIGTGTPGFRNRRPVFRDIAVEAWYDYLGWSNHTAHSQPIHFGKAKLQKGSDILTDPEADFTKLDLKQASSLLVHWGTANAGVKNIPEGDVEGGDPNSKVYEVVKVLGKNRVQINPPAVATTESSYSIGRRSYGSFKVSNCRFIILDTKSHRELHDIDNPGKKGISMIGKQQREWMMDLMAKKDADFYFVVSSVNFMIPHVGSGGGFSPTTKKGKDDAWTVFLDEREKLINFWDKLGKRVFILSGDLHNSFAVKITDSVWEFGSGPHNSVNHMPKDEGNRPVNGMFKYGPRECEIRWSTIAHEDLERSQRMMPHFCVVQINNVYNNPLKMGGERLVAFPKPHVVFKYYDGMTGKLKYAEPIHAK